MMPLFGHVGLALATSFSGLMAGVVMGLLLYWQRRLGLAWRGMMGRIFLATIVMVILLVTLATVGGELRHNLPAAIWLAFLVFFGGAAFFGTAMLLKAIPIGLVNRWQHRKT